MTKSEMPDLSLFADRREDRLRVTDIDFQGHVNNAIFVQFLASARYDFLGAYVRPHLGEGGKLVVAGTEIAYRAEMLYGTPVETLTRVSRLGRSSMVIEQLILQGGKLVSSATTTMVYRLGGVSTAWPETVQSQFGEKA